ncbi:cell wall metabolism sensor histidine kinase WalK [Persicimonas caeni]|uniref:histidine kinase n=1 Tax=Persicimonas caeni TaxID=2292766 RepID=A0A4Y6PX29_PERCE|nr:ATP-binding protein [Persicimonas caeni]QDG52881.1 cell wall metabolism sensor histidine kinase WalK [Persicimonas caeni]QED34103.1 cell wall metabolism sensor histidine kinase WalK [Persicimonas caeni]
MRAKLFLVSLVLMAVVGLSSAAYLENALRGWLVSRIESELKHSARAADALLVSAIDADDPSNIAAIDPLADRMGEATDSRVTVIRTDGVVLGDSELSVDEVNAVENHANRPEIQEALTSGIGVSQRYSTTVDKKMMYVALPFRTEKVRGVVRASVPLREVDDSVETLRWMIFVASLLGLGVAIFMSGLASHLLARTLRKLVNYARSISRGESSGRPPLDESDEIVSGLTGSMTRLSDELSRTVDELARERDRFEAVLENMSEAVVAVDDERRVTLVNRAAVELLELQSNPVGRPLVEVVRAPGLQKLLDASEKGRPGGEEFEVAVSSTKLVLAQASPRQETVGTVVVMHDVTELRRLETMRRDFVANVSHELRTPVSIIRATAETLQEGALDDPKHAKRFLDALIRNSERLGRLISDLLDISRIEAGEYALEAGELPLQRAAERAVDAVAAHAASRSIDISIDITDDLCAVADANALDQVLLNLVGNAVKYSHEGGQVSIRGRSLDEHVVLEVVDDGPGIPAAHRDRIFERFYRVDSGRSREVGGTGLGLSIVKHLVTSMNGQIGYKAATPRGSIFWFTLPAC